MARQLVVYPKASIEGSTWTFLVKVDGVRFSHTVPAGVTIPSLKLLKLVFGLIVADSDTNQDVDDAFFLDDIRPGPQLETVWGNWQELAESIITSLPPDPDEATFWAAWSQQDTAGVRSDARRALITQRGWTVPGGSIHQHEGDGTNLDDGF